MGWIGSEIYEKSIPHINFQHVHLILRHEGEHCWLVSHVVTISENEPGRIFGEAINRVERVVWQFREPDGQYAKVKSVNVRVFHGAEDVVDFL
jgi:hypothetical protein